MALSFTRLSWLWYGGKEIDHVLSGSVTNAIKSSVGDWGVGFRGEPESLKFYTPSSSSNRKVKKKWKSREERSKKIDREYDVVLVPSDGVCLSGSDSDASDWSIGWLEPHTPEFHTDDGTDDSFAVLVPCYRRGSQEATLNAASNFPAVYSGTRYMQQWLSSLEKHEGATTILSCAAADQSPSAL